jgi:hypothetical protein
MLDGPSPDEIEPHRELWGFGGLHGGLTLALLTNAMQAAAPGLVPRGVAATYHRAIRSPFRVEASPVRAGRVVTTAAAAVTSPAGVHVTATATFGSAGRSGWPEVAPAPPLAPPPHECPVFTIPPEFVPFASKTEIRPVGPNRPFGGGPEPVLTAWLRLTEDDRPPDVARLVVLIDALAPSYAAVLTVPQVVPTVELSVRPSSRLADASSPWVLLEARTLSAGTSGWVDERIDAWGPDGEHLGAAHQLRIVVAG